MCLTVSIRVTQLIQHRLSLRTFKHETHIASAWWNSLRQICAASHSTLYWQSKDAVIPEGRRLDGENLDSCLSRIPVSLSQFSGVHDLQKIYWEKSPCIRESLYLGNENLLMNIVFHHTEWHLIPGNLFQLKKNYSLGWCSSVDWAWACEPKGHQFDSQSGHMSGLQARSPVGSIQESTTHWCFSPSLSSSLPLSKNK